MEEWKRRLFAPRWDCGNVGVSPNNPNKMKYLKAAADWLDQLERNQTPH